MGFEITELRLGLPGSETAAAATIAKKKRSFMDAYERQEAEDAGSSTRDGEDSTKPAAVVGWPPICSYRKNNLKKAKVDERERMMIGSEVTLYVKVSMDGAPFLRKINLKAYNEYSDLSRLLPTMFSNLLPLGDRCTNSEYITIYQDKEHDWMLVGDVPWEMFLESCQRLRIMRRNDAINNIEAGRKDMR